MAYSAPKLELVRDNIVRVYPPETIEPRTYLTASVAAAGVTLTVENNEGFANKDILLYEGFGIENAEIKQVNGAITAGTSITTSATTLAHGVNTPIGKLLFDQIEISGASTATGSKTAIATASITASAMFNDYIVAGTTYAFYFARYYNSLATVPYYGAYSDAIASTDFTVNTVGFVRRAAFNNIGETYGGRWNDQRIYDQIYLCEEDLQKAKSKWSALVVNNYDLGNVTTGMQRIAMPSDIADNQSSNAIYGLRIGVQNNMYPIERPEFEDLMQNIAHTTNSATINITDLTVTLTDSNDFADSGSININGTSYSYTTNTRSTGVLSGFTAFTILIASGSDIWQNVTFGEPIRFLVNNGYIYFDVPPSSDYNGRNIWLDYYKKAVKPTSDGATLNFNESQAYISWIEMAIKRDKANGELAPTDSSYIMYQQRRKALATQDRMPGGLRVVPDVPSRSMFRGWWR